jgi:hypothetical protein
MNDRNVHLQHKARQRFYLLNRSHVLTLFVCPLYSSNTNIRTAVLACYYRGRNNVFRIDNILHCHIIMIKLGKNMTYNITPFCISSLKLIVKTKRNCNIGYGLGIQSSRQISS